MIFKLNQSSIKNVTKQFTAKGIEGYDALSFINAAKKGAIKIINENRNSKVYIALTCVIEHTSILIGETMTTTSVFRTNNQVVLETTDLNELYDSAQHKFLASLSSFQELGSSNKNAIINIKNEDNQYFKWCVARALNPNDNHPERVDKELKNKAENINWDEIESPVSVNQITRFENNNQDITVNVFGYENSEVHILRVSKNNERNHLIDLLLISNGETNHYCLIKNLSRLLSSQTSKNKCTIHNCRNYLLGLNSEEPLSNHKTYCETHDSVRIKLPPTNSAMQLTNHNESMRVPFVVYDFESFIKPIDICKPNPNESYNNNIKNIFQVHYVIILNVLTKIKFPKRMIFTYKNKHDFNAAISCHICGKDLENYKVRDHCHITKKYRGAAHQNCNLNYKIPKFFPVLFHDLSGYDSQLFIKKLSRGKLSCIPNNEEKYISFSKEIKVDEFINKEGKKVEVKRELCCSDSCKFMSDSLDALSKSLAKDQCKNIGKFYSDKKLDLLLRKGIYPNDWVDSINRFNETQLPRKESFFSRLNGEEISDNNYSHAQNVWKEFNCELFRDYHNLYNVLDVLLLADIFENFRDLCIRNYDLGPAWYYTVPGLAWDAALKMTEIKLQLLSDYDILLMIKKGIRGGIRMISNDI
ncbi:uncharacterized protein LOC136089892 [Hydra vulgaris]|uniref:Uncharacterized protein LOC136089892 n=1 Tax=Hydra vulgaris TaxID=6087 RepID=A0ABM4DCF7_HYDVU